MKWIVAAVVLSFVVSALLGRLCSLGTEPDDEEIV